LLSRLLRAWPTILFWVLGVALVLAIGYEAFTTQAITGFQVADFYEHSAALRALLEDGLDPGVPPAVARGGEHRAPVRPERLHGVHAPGPLIYF
jgi:hypothetical protein